MEAAVRCVDTVIAVSRGEPGVEVGVRVCVWGQSTEVEAAVRCVEGGVEVGEGFVSWGD